MGIAYRERIEGERSENIERAIAAYEAALLVYARDAFPTDWAMIHLKLGTAYADRHGGDRAENTERAIQAYEAALNIYTPEDFPTDWAMTQNNLGTAYAERIWGDRADNLDRAVQSLQAVLETSYLPERLPKESRTVAQNLARLHEEQRNWNAAHSALRLALQAAEHLYTAALTEEGNTAEIDENAYLYRQMVDVCLHLDPPRRLEAFLHVEEGRSRLLRDQLAALPIPLPLQVPAELIEKERVLLQVAHNLETTIATASNEAARRT